MIAAAERRLAAQREHVEPRRIGRKMAQRLQLAEEICEIFGLLFPRAPKDFLHRLDRALGDAKASVGQRLLGGRELLRELAAILLRQNREHRARGRLDTEQLGAQQLHAQFGAVS